LQQNPVLVTGMLERVTERDLLQRSRRIYGASAYEADNHRNWPVRNIGGLVNPIKILREAIRAVPALKYALAVAGIAATVAIVVGLKLQPQIAVFGSLIVIGLMFILVVFAQYAGAPTSRLRGPASVLIWFYTGAVVVTTSLLITGYFFSVPRLHFGQTAEAVSVPFKRTFHFNGKAIRVTPSPTLDFGFSSLELDPTSAGQTVTVTQLKAIFKSINHSKVICCDVWMFLGTAPFQFPEGASTVSQIGSYPWDVLREAPTQVKLNLGRPGESPDSYNYAVTYSFLNGTCAVIPAMGCAVKAFKNLPMSLTSGLYAQVFVWTGFVGADLEIEQIELEVEGTMSTKP
jgi:hypothetical protein